LTRKFFADVAKTCGDRRASMSNQPKMAAIRRRSAGRSRARVEIVGALRLGAGITDIAVLANQRPVH
jgi:hypothetical protein